MTSEQKAHLGLKVFPTMAEITGRSFSGSAFIMMVESLDDLDYNAVIKTLSEWQRTEKNFPHPSDIRAKIMPEIDSKDSAIEVANLLISAVSKYGYVNPERAKLFVGELAWETVTRMGGWKHLCESLTFDNESIIRAQIRQYAEVVSKKAKRGELDQTPSLPKSNEVQKLIQSAFKAIENV